MLNTAIEQTTDTTGTGTYALVASTNPLFRSFVQAIGSGQAVWYRAELGSAWEEGWGIATAGTPDTLTRNVVASSNANALVSWPAGSKRLFCTLLADAARFGAGGQLPTSGGTANALTLAHAPACRVLRPGMTFCFMAGASNTGAATLNIDGLGALPVQRHTGTACGGSEMQAGTLVQVTVNNGLTAFLLPPLAVPVAFFRLNSGSGSALALPAGGVWKWQYTGFNAAGGTYMGTDNAGVSAGGTTIQAGTAGVVYLGWAERVA